MNKDAFCIISGGFVRSVAVSLISVTYGLYVAFLGLSPFQLGILVAAGLIGMAGATFIVLFWGDRLGRRRLLVALAFLGAGGGVATAYSNEITAFLVSAFVGMLNGMGRDRGAAAALDQAMLASVVSNDTRTRFFAIYSFSQGAGHAIGSGLAAMPVLIQKWLTVDEATSYQGTIIIYAAILLLSAFFAARISNRAEHNEVLKGFNLAPETRKRVWKISALFGVDALGGGLLTGTLLAYYFHERYGVGAAEISGLVAGARVANALSYFIAVWIAGKIGLIRTMVFTHLPSNLLLVALALAPHFWIAVLIYLVQQLLVEMDVPTRNSYVMAIIQPKERTAVAGITQLVRVAGWGIAPIFGGALMGKLTLAAPLFLGAGIKACYDMGLYFNFRSIPAPEEKVKTNGGAGG